MRLLERILIAYHSIFTLVVATGLIIILMYLTGCQTTPPVPIPVQDILTEPAEKGQKLCVEVEDLLCPARTTMYVVYRHSSRCVWTWSCVK